MRYEDLLAIAEDMLTAYEELAEEITATDKLRGMRRTLIRLWKATLAGAKEGETRTELKADPDSRPFSTYAIGYEHKPNSFGMAYGPTPNLEDMLEVVPDEEGACLFEFLPNNGGERVICRWVDGEWKDEPHGGI